MLNSLLILIFIRPFISSLAFPEVNLIYSILLLGFLGIWLVLKGLPLKEIKPIKYPLILLCVALIISVVFSQNKLNSLLELYKYISGMLLFLIAISLTHENKIRVIRAIILAGLIISLLAIYQYFFGFKQLLNYIVREKITDPFVLDYVERKRVFFPFVTPNTLAGYFALIIPLVLIIQDKSRWLVLSTISFALLLTKSLGAFLSIFLTLIIYSYLEGKLKRKRILFIISLSIIFAFLFIIRSATQKQHFRPIFSTVMRINYWKDTLNIIKASPLTGVGLGNFNLMQSRYTHNSYFQIWAEMGILGIVSILWFITAVFKSALKNMKDSVHKNITASLVSANSVFLIHNFVDFTFFLPEVALIWWVILGLILSQILL